MEELLAASIDRVGESTEPMETELSKKALEEDYSVIFSGNIPGAPIIRLEDLKKIGLLGQGASGYVEKSIHIPTNTPIAVKVNIHQNHAVDHTPDGKHDD